MTGCSKTNLVPYVVADPLALAVSGGERLCRTLGVNRQPFLWTVGH